MPLQESDKRKFLNTLPNEDFLRVQILIPLFQEMGFLEVIDTHGADEKGKDIVLIGYDALEELEYWAVIVKNEAITNAASHKTKEIVSNVSSQIIGSILSGYDCLRQKRKVQFNKIIVVSSKNIATSAKPELITIAKQHSATGIYFWDQTRLISEINKHLPNVYLIRKGGLSKYFHSLQITCEKLNELKNISIYKGEVRDLIDVFVEPRLHRKVEKIGQAGAIAEDECVLISDLVNSRKNCLIYGPAGSGKSTLIRSQILKLIFDYENRKNKVIPVFIKLKEFVTDALSDGEKKAGGQLYNYLTKKYGLLKREADDIFGSTEDSFVFFLDGFDELTSQEEIALFEQFRLYLESNPNINYILTSRNKFGLLDMTSSKVEDWKILDFNIGQVKTFFKKWLKNKHDTLLEALQDHNLLEHLPKTPLSMTLIAIIFDADNDVELPSNLAELYKMFTELLLGRWNLDRKASTFYKANDKDIFLTDIAMYLHSNRKISCTEAELLGVFKKSEEKIGRDINYENMLHELIVNTNLLVKNERNEFEFRHLSFQEYFVGCELHSTNRFKILLDEFPDAWWSQVLYFYCGIKKSNEGLLISLMNRIQKLKDIVALKATWQMGYLVQSSYKTHASIRTTIILKSATYYAESMKKAIERVLEKNKKIPESMLYLSVADMFRIHFKSRFLFKILKDVYSELVTISKRDFISGLSILLVANILAELGDVDCLADSEKYYKNFPLLVFMENMELSCCLELDMKDKEKKKEIRKIATKLMMRMKKNPLAYRKYFGGSLKQLN